MTDRDVLRVKLLGNWGPSEQLCREWSKMSQGALRWNDIEVCSDDDVDFYVLANHPRPGEHYVPERTIVLQMEPWCGEEHQTWGVKTWGEWARPDPVRFLQVRAHEHFLNTVLWLMRSSYHELSEGTVTKTKTLSTMCSAKYFDPGHIRRVDFLHFLDEQDDDVVRVDVFAPDNPHGFTSWVGPHPPGANDTTLLPYKYVLGVENNAEHNFITEKMWDPLLAEALCFYWGAPNAEEHVDPRAFIRIDLDDFDSALATMREAILADEWSKRIDVIRAEKRRVLDELQFFPMVERVLRHEFRFERSPSDVEVLLHKYFADDLDATLDRVAFVHSFTSGGDTRILRELLDAIDAAGGFDRVYIVNVGEPIDLGSVGRGHGDVHRLIHRESDHVNGESGTLRLVHAFSTEHRATDVLYVHTKGASYDETFAVIEDWRELMSYFLVERAEQAQALLAEHDVVGCNLEDLPFRHFAGNFWWARGEHLALLAPPAGDDRHASEWWVCSNPTARLVSMHDSGINHYHERYPRDRYAG